jgi:hypothetical protein
MALRGIFFFPSETTIFLSKEHSIGVLFTAFVCFFPFEIVVLAFQHWHPKWQ